jgi:hypothetical protein
MSVASPFGKIIGVNLLVLLIYSIGLKVTLVLLGDNYTEGYVAFMAFILVIHVALDLLLALALGIAGKRDAALGFLASAPVVLLVGGGMCFAGAAIEVGGSRSR